MNMQTSLAKGFFFKTSLSKEKARTFSYRYLFYKRHILFTYLFYEPN